MNEGPVEQMWVDFSHKVEATLDLVALSRSVTIKSDVKKADKWYTRDLEIMKTRGRALDWRWRKSMEPGDGCTQFGRP